MIYIKGKPGAGKSTVLMEAFKNAKALPNEVVASSFFFCRGNLAQNSPISLFRSLLHQILDQHPSAGAELIEIHKNRRHTESGQGKEVQWCENELKGWLRTIISNVSAAWPMRIYVDALDEAGDAVAFAVENYFRR
jgi:predicted ATPase